MEQRAIGETRERIMERSVDEFGLDPLAIGDVVDVDDHAADGWIVGSVHDPQRQPTFVAVGVHDAHLRLSHDAIGLR